MRAILVTFFILLFVSVFIQAQESDTILVDAILDMSLEELLQVKIESATYTKLEAVKTPGSITTISHEEIISTPHRNLLDLLEVYVPGATFVNHWQGPRLGIRGIISDQNHSYLLIVNGENLNMQSRNGPFFEIQNKDLEDIEKIEIIRGPGSVVYGPGAIGGVISITTKKAKKEEKVHVSAKHDLVYRYSKVKGAFSFSGKRFLAQLDASYCKSEGIESPQFYYIDRAHGYGYGFMSESWGNRGLGTSAPNFYGDFENRPELKVNFKVDFLNDFTFWARYTSFSFIKQQQQTASMEGPAFPGLYGQQITSVFKKKHQLSEKTVLTSSVSFQSQSHGNIQLYQGENMPFDDITQRHSSFSENKTNVKALLNSQLLNKLELAIGAEYNYWYYGPEWGKAKNSFVMDFAPPIRFAVTDTTSGFYRQYNSMGIVTYLDEKIDASQVSGFFEANYQPSEKTTILFSGRVDKHEFSDYAFSSRVAFIRRLMMKDYVKLIANYSVRFPAFSDLYAIDYHSNSSTCPEILRGIEAIYSRIQNENLMFNLSLFYNDIEQIAWLEEGRAGLVGEFDLFGIETDVTYRTKKFKAGMNYTYIRQTKWDAVDPIDSYLANIGQDGLDYQLAAGGENRINNLPSHQLKMFLGWQFNQKLHFHFNGRFAFGYNQIDMLDMFKSIHDTYGTQETRQEMQNIYNDVVSYGYSKPSFTSNISVNYKIPFRLSDLTISAYAMNILEFNNIRYVYQFWESGNLRQYPRQVGFVEEPLSVGVRVCFQL